MYNFDTPISREGTHTEKYDARLEKFGRADVMPLWVADMDLPTSTQIQHALQERIAHPIYGYTHYHTGYFDAIRGWMAKQHAWAVEREWIAPINAIVAGLNLAVEVLSERGEGVLIQPPIYPPFYGAVRKQKRRLLENVLQLHDGRYEIDFDDFEAKAREVKLFLFCSPHNPTGRVWERWELERMAQICRAHGVTILSDEVHADLTQASHRHIPIASLPDAADITITLNAPSKTFNIAGIVTAYAIVPNSSLRRRYHEIFRRYSLDAPSLISQTATIAAYTRSEAWLAALRGYLADNLAYLYESFVTMPKIVPIRMEATFLLWLDCRGMGMDDAALQRWFADEAGLGLNPGSSFGRGGEGFMRLNFALPRAQLEAAMHQLTTAYRSFEGINN